MCHRENATVVDIRLQKFFSIGMNTAAETFDLCVFVIYAASLGTSIFASTPVSPTANSKPDSGKYARLRQRSDWQRKSIESSWQKIVL